MRYEVEVTEVLHRACTFTVEADSPQEARELASIGETVREARGGKYEVVDRIVESEPIAK